MAIKVDAEVLANSTYVDNPYDYEFFEGGPLTDEENKAIQRAIARDRRRELNRETARQIGVIKAMQRKGLAVKRASITGVPVEFGPLETPATGFDSERDAPFANPWDQVYAADKERPS
jgi:hypothetical protein